MPGRCRPAGDSLTRHLAGRVQPGSHVSDLLALVHAAGPGPLLHPGPLHPRLRDHQGQGEHKGRAQSAAHRGQQGVLPAERRRRVDPGR
eukprot:scaffold650303_cov48-Prasinocladus_malaysianus.AAC.1